MTDDPDWSVLRFLSGPRDGDVAFGDPDPPNRLGDYVRCGHDPIGRVIYRYEPKESAS